MTNVSDTAMNPEHQPKHSNISNAYFLGLTGVIIFGATLPATTLALNDFSPWFITFARALIAGLCAIAWLLATRRSVFHAENSRMFAIGLFLVFGFPGCMALGLLTVPTSHGGVVLGLLPIATAIASALLTGERPSAKFWTLSVLGAVIVVVYAYTHNSAGAETGLAVGDLWLLAATGFAATGYVLSGKLSQTMPGYEVICRALILNFPMITIGVIFLWEPEFIAPSAAGLSGMIYLGLFSMFLGFFAWNTALAIGGIARIGQLQLLQVFVTITLSAFVLGETIDALTIVTALVVTGIIALIKRT